MHTPLEGLHNRTELSADPVKQYSPLELYLATKTAAECPVRVLSANITKMSETAPLGSSRTDDYKGMMASVETEMMLLPRHSSKEMKYLYKPVWRRALMKLRLRRALNSLNEDIILYGTSNEVFDIGTYEEIMHAKSDRQRLSQHNTNLPWYLMSPKCPYLYFWNIVIALLLIYTATIMPVRIAFTEPIYFDGWTIFETLVDMLFIKDIFVNCFTSYKNDKGDYESDIRKIMFTYIKSWFFIDLISSFPMGLIEYSEGIDSQGGPGKANRFARLARLPRLYKLFRIIRITKLGRIYKGNPLYEKIDDWLDVNGRFLRLFKFLISIFLFVHFFACFFYFAAKIEGMTDETWVFQMGYQDKSIGSIYLCSFYWAFTTIATVGYGDIHAFTEVEMVVCIIAMGFGVAFYSMIISSITSLISSIDIREATINNKVRAAEEFGKEAGLNRETINKIRQVIQHNATVFSIDNLKLIDEMPKILKVEVTKQMYNGLARCMPMFAGRDPSFIVYVIARLKPIFFDEGDSVYKENDPPEDMFVIFKGRVSLTIKAMRNKKIDFKGFLKGTNFGEIELLANCRRIDNATVFSIAEVLAMPKESFNEMLEEFPSEIKKMRSIAELRLDRNYDAKLMAMRAVGVLETTIAEERQKYLNLKRNFETSQRVYEGEIALKRLEKTDKKLKSAVNQLEEELRLLQSYE
mmetsp:Transcript_6864/g.12484  ORF Transcript_6864/g.12484 Transcript_6864/m.12484 type:complete len:692 (-) Transcript_6864:52-2127(-)